MYMRTSRTLFLSLLFSILAAVCSQSALADEAASIYDPSKVFFIDLTLSHAEELKLEAEPGEYVKGTFSLTRSTDGTPAGEESTPFIAPQAVEVRLKGNVGGSFRPLSGKAGFKLKFKKTEAVLGLRKMTLNNMVQDPSMVHETLAYAAFRAAGVPASRTGYAYVRLNGNDIGVYLDLENLDEVGLSRIFGSFDKNTQHLYEGEGGHDVKPGEATAFEVDEGPEDNIADLEALIAAVNDEAGGPFSERVAATANLAEMTKMWAVEKYIDHWDGYSGHAEAGLRPNNYYLFSESSGRFQMLPWGADQTWIPTIGVGTPGREVTFDGKGGVLFNKCLEDEECFRAYWNALHDLQATIAGLDPAMVAEDTAGLLAPWQAEERAHGRAEYDSDEIKDGVDETLQFIAGRQAEASAWLTANEPPEEEGGEGEEEENGEEEGGGEIEGGTPSPSGNAGSSSSTKGVPAPGSVIINGFFLDRGVLSSRLGFSSPGTVTQWVTMRTPGGRRNVCTVQDQPVSLAATIRCELSRSARQRLAKHRLRLGVNISFTPQNGGAPAALYRVLAARKGADS